MNVKNIRAIGTGLLVIVWLALTGFAWFGPANTISEAERRELAQMPDITIDTVLDGSFMTEFEEYSLDQFPLRDDFRRIKAITHNYILRQKDNNDIYIVDGYAAKMEYPLSEPSVKYAIGRFQNIYSKYLDGTDCNIYFAAVPDKGYYLAEENGYLTMDYEQLFSSLKTQLPWAQFVDLTDTLTYESYYRTDTHWRQEKLFNTARKLAQAMGGVGPNEADFTKTRLDRAFYGVYYGQAALPMEAEPMYLMESPTLTASKVYNYENGKTTQVYDRSKLGSQDLYDVYLSGAAALLRIDNPKATTDKELIVFRDSFGSSIVPLLVQDYASVTLVDLRYVNSAMLGNFLEFSDQDVLLIYSTLVLNSSASLK